jgi:formamidopyrimidine-DNA glycosylase
MLELPELEVSKDRLRLALVGKRVVAVELHKPAALEKTDVATEKIVGAHFKNVGRVGRHLCFEFDSGVSLYVNLGREGHVHLYERAPARLDAVLTIQCEKTGLRVSEQDARRPVRIALLTGTEEVAGIADCQSSIVNCQSPIPRWLGGLGLDPVSPDFTLDRLRRLLERRDRPVRHVLTDQRAIAGLGEAYADEILFEARLSPFQTTSELKPEDVIRLHAAINKTISLAVVYLKALPKVELPVERDRNLKVHRRKGRECHACASAIHLVRDGKILTNYCPTCQTGGRTLEDREPVPAKPAAR